MIQVPPAELPPLPDEQEASPPTASLEALFRPRSIAVIGASSDPAKIGGRPVKYLKGRYRGPIYPVNRAGGRVQGLAAYCDLSAVGRPVDLVMICVPAEGVPAAVETCAACGVRAAIVISSGFAETGSQGRALQDRLTTLARDAGMRLLGPNCLGLMNFAEGVIATFSIVVEQGEIAAGPVGIVSQSGAFAAHAYALAQRRGMGLSHWVTTGNEGDVDLADCLAFLAEDPATRVIMAYMEGCRDGPKLVAALRLARERGKPVIAVKVGRSAAGAQAAASHTAALAGADAVYDALFEQFGVYRAGTIDEFFDVAYACSLGRFPRHNRIGIASISGGVGIFMADRAAERGLDVAPMPAAAQARLKALLPIAGVRNPVDVTAQILNDPALFEQCLSVLLEEGDYAAAAVFLTTVFATEGLKDRFLTAFERLRERNPQAVIAVCTLAPAAARERLAALGYAVFEEPARTVDALAALARLAAAPPLEDGEPSGSAKVLPLPDGPLDEHQSKTWLAAAGLAMAREHLALDPAQAVAAAEALRYPVVMKVASDIPHKSDIGGVMLGIADAAGVRAAYSRLTANARAACPGADIKGVIVAEHVRGGVEVIIGANNDPVFGPVVMLGLGGVFVEIMGDVTFRLAPFGIDEAHRMIARLRCAPLLQGARGRPKADIPALAEALARLSQIAFAARHAVDSIDINPLMVLPEGQGAVALDALVVRRRD